MSKFKKGDKVVALEDHSGYTLTKGKTYVVDSLDYDGDPRVINDEGYKVGVFSFYFELAPKRKYNKRKKVSMKVKTLDNLEVGDVLVLNGRFERTVLAVVRSLIALSVAGDPTDYLGWYTVTQLNKNGHKLKAQPEQPKELTLKEIEEKLGYSVKIKRPVGRPRKEK